MSEQFETFIVHQADPLAMEDLNKFLRGHRVLKVDRIYDSGAWHFCVEWQPGPEADCAGNRSRERIDYKDVLDAPTFALFADLRELRKELSQRERVPAYAVFTNEQLAAIAKLRCEKKSDLEKVEGLGAGRVEKYGSTVLERIAKYEEQQSQTGADCSTGESA